MSAQFHIPVMAAEVADYLRITEDGLYVDCTLGDGGHSLDILSRGGRVLGIDRDPEAVANAVKRLESFGDRFRARNGRFSGIMEIVGGESGVVDGIVMDLGVSSRMIDDPSRGFSYRHDGPLLMTMGDTEQTAYDVVRTMSAVELAAVFRRYGEERDATRIARAIVDARSSRSIETTGDLAEIIEKTVGFRHPQKSKARVFQALRIYINREMEELEAGLEGACAVLRSGGRLCVISYHSIEDRMVKNFLREHANPCICPPDLPVCRCGRTPDIRVVTRKPAAPRNDEVDSNPRARSARLRVGEKL